MHQVNYKYVLGFIAVSTLVLGTTLMQNKTDENAPDPDVQALDAKLLSDLQQQDITIDKRTQCIMECASISEEDLRLLLDIKNLNYEKCESGNCHYTSYTIEGKTSGGETVMFKIDSGEEGNLLRDLTLQQADCDCI